jgi:2-aminoethylphosphonate dioxygenase
MPSSAARRASLPAAPLAPAQLAAFARDGVLAVGGLFGARAMAEIERWTEELATAPEAPGRHWVYREQSLLDPARRVLQRIENFFPFHDGFRRLMTRGELVDATAQLLGDAPVLFKDKINFKMPGGDGFKPHQDQQAGWSGYAPYFITALISIDDATVENGCLEVLPGRHKEGMIGAEWRPLSEAETPRAEYRPLPTRRGDVVFFGSYAPHASGPNLTAAPRRVLYITWNRAADGDHRLRYYADKHKNFPPDIEREAGKSYVFRV